MGEARSWKKPIRRAAAVCGSIVAGLLFVFIALWFGTPPRVPDQPLRFVRDDSGQMVQDGDTEHRQFPWLEIQAGKLESQNTLASSAMSSQSGQARFACARIAVFNRSDHLLMARVGRRLLDEFQDLPDVREVDYYPAGFRAAEGRPGPDLVVTLDLERITESPGLITSQLKAAIAVRSGNLPPGCHHTVIDNLTPPLVRFDWSGRLTHHSTTTGLVSSAAKYKQAAEDIAHQIGTDLAKDFAERSQKHAALPDLSSGFYPAYRPRAAPPLEGLGDLERIWSWHGLMNHNETLWRITPNRPASDLVLELQKRLQAAGWEATDEKLDPKSPFLRVRRGSLVLQAYPAPSGESSRPAASAPAGPGTPAEAKAPSAVYVHLLDRMTGPELDASIDRVLEDDPLAEAILLFENRWSKSQQERILTTLPTAPVMSPERSLTLAGLLQRFKQDEESRRELLRAQVLLRALENPEEFKGRLLALAKDLGDEGLAQRAIDAARLRDAGFVELGPGIALTPREVKVDEPALFFLDSGLDADGLRTIALRVVKSAPSSSSAAGFAFVDATEHGRSFGRAGPEHVLTVGGKDAVRFRIQPGKANGPYYIAAEWILTEE